MLFDKLSDIAVPADWLLVTVALAVGAFMAAAAMAMRRDRIQIRKRMLTIETQLSKMQREIASVLQIQVALMMKRNANPTVKTDSPDTSVEMGGGDVAELTISPPTTPAQPESVKSEKLPGW
jgi:hypothetical protein